MSVIIYFDKSNQRSSEELFNKYFVPYENHLSVRNSQGNVDSVLVLAMMHYDLGEYDEALKYFNLLDDMSNLVSLYKGISYLSINVPDSARDQGKP